MFTYSQNIQPVSYLKAHTAEVLRNLRETRSPVVITQNGEAAAVLIDVESYQKTLNALSLAKLIGLGSADIEAGRTVPHNEAKKRFKETLSQDE